ncbi:MAG: hypothetical protein BMS9Abin15_0052 [Gammaproteobacteria bacterium]|nr:MAG: hypothetical protein BMS9Abin15_0052 [Gammaproteobacteria bacterium]
MSTIKSQEAEKGNRMNKNNVKDPNMRAFEVRNRELYDDTPAIFFTLNADGIILSVNRFGAEQLGYTLDELLGQSISVVYPEGLTDALQTWITAFLQQPDIVHVRQSKMVRKSGDGMWYRNTVRIVREAGNEERLLMVCEDTTVAHTLSEKLSYQETHDPLTGLVNRREFEHRLQQSMDITSLNDIEHTLCYIDLDQFKVINNTCGYVAGDELLRQVGSLLRGLLKQNDIVARIDGDEFGILLMICPMLQADKVIMRLRDAIRAHVFTWEDKSFDISSSIGVAPVNTAVKKISSAMNMADAALFAAKDAGRNRIRMFDQSDSELAQQNKEMKLVSSITKAIREDRFHLYYQKIMPIINGQQREHYELLVRMEDEEGNMVLPGNFLPAAERFNLSSKLDQWVVERAFSWLDANPEKLENLQICSINISGQTLSDDHILSVIVHALNNSSIPPEKICFEITETAAITSLNDAKHFIHTLKEDGCKFALDDFGSGFSSFAYLKNLPVDYLKIDGTFVKNIVNDPIDYAMVKSINEIGHVMGKQTIAEFVEDDAILKKLKEIGVNYAQGYGIEEPRPLM